MSFSFAPCASGSLCLCLVAPQGLDQLQEWAEASLAGIRPDPPTSGRSSPLSTPPTLKGCRPNLELSVVPLDASGSETSGPTPGGHTGSSDGGDGGAPRSLLRYGGTDWPEWRYDGSGIGDDGYGSLVSPPDQQLGLMYRVRPQRELRELELRWYLPYGSMKDVR